jgi:hypothetical protein
MKRFYCTCIVLAFFNFSTAQDMWGFNTEMLSGNDYMAADDRRNSFYTTLEYSVKRSDELNWQNLSLSANGEQQTVVVRYNPIKDAIEIKDANKIYEIAKRHNVSVTFAETNVTYQAKSYYGDDGKIYTSYFIVDSSFDDVGVLKKESFKRDERRWRKRRNGTIRFNKIDMYYIIDGNNKLFYLTTDRATIRKSFPDRAPSIIKYIRKNKLRESRYDDIIKLAKYIKTFETQI